jgi:hypothetical protein
MNGFKDIFSVIVDPYAPEGIAVVGRPKPQVLLTIFEGRTMTHFLMDKWPEDMSEENPISSVESVYGGDTVYMVGKPVSGLEIDMVIKNVD